MNKDVIYIDVDDDVTAIIGKIKAAKEKIVALVPPKRVGTLQSAVNLRLLERMAKAEKKQLVLITGNQALVALAANAKIPVAKNLQTKPEIAEIAAVVVDNDDDIIDGSNLPIGEHADTVKVTDGTKLSNGTRLDAVDETDLEIEEGVSSAIGVATLGDVDKSSDNGKKSSNARSNTGTGRGGKASKSGPKLPNFDGFRKRLFLIVAGLAGLTALLIWMFVFAPAATVIITASTTPESISASVKLGGTSATDYSKGVVSSLSEQDKKDLTVEFEATGVGKVGDKATGTVIFKNYESSSPVTIPAGTTLTSGGRTYVTTEDGTASGALFLTEGVSGPVGIQATEVGAEYNVDDGTTFAVAGHSLSGLTYFKAVSNVDIAGGNSHEVKVVSADDIERAKGQLVGQSTDNYKNALVAKFQTEQVIVEGSFTVDRGDAKSTPALGEESADGKAILTIPTTFSVQAVSKSELDSFLKQSVGSKLDKGDKIYSTGIDAATLSNFKKSDKGEMTATVTATARTGPTIDENAIKEQVKGKIYGEVQQGLQAMDGIKDVDVEFSYFWVRRVPNDTNKIKIEFKIDTDNG